MGCARARVGLALGLSIASLTLACNRITTREARRIAEPAARARAVPCPSPPQTLLDEADALGDTRQRLVLQTALQQVGASSRGLDCSTFVCRAYATAGLPIPSTVRKQMSRGTPVASSDLSPGDLVFFAFRHRPADHVGIYAGRGSMVHVSSAARSVQVASLDAAPFAGAFVGARRLLSPPATP